MSFAQRCVYNALPIPRARYHRCLVGVMRRLMECRFSEIASFVFRVLPRWAGGAVVNASTRSVQFVRVIVSVMYLSMNLFILWPSQLRDGSFRSRFWERRRRREVFNAGITRRFLPVKPQAPVKDALLQRHSPLYPTIVHESWCFRARPLHNAGYISSSYVYMP